MTDGFFAAYEPRGEQPQHVPVEHQARALEGLSRWYGGGARTQAGGLLVVPTGGGKTFIAVRFLCGLPLSAGRKVLWMAHTHHLLEQAYEEFSEGAKLLAPSKHSLRVRVVSGAEGHWDASRVEATDDVVIATLQTIRGGLKRGAPGLVEFMEAAGDGLVVVFDEAHHSPARTYRQLLLDLRRANPTTYFLGLTATPTYSDEKKRGWLTELFPDGHIYQVRADELMARGILARPKFKQVDVDFTPTFKPEEYRAWVRSNRDLPESVIAQLATNRERNEFIADHYTEHREQYGRTLVFVDRWAQAVAVEELLKRRGVRAGSMFSQIDIGGTAAERNRRDRDHNDKVLAAFKSGELDVIVNIRMLTEGTDVPDAETVFITRQTRSRILLTQMIGRALRGPRFGGTEEANVVTFIDDWRELINWAEWTEVLGELEDGQPKQVARNPLQLIRIELVRRLAHQMDGASTPPATFVETLPLGWYRANYEFSHDGDQIDDAREFLVVFPEQYEAYEAFLDDFTARPWPAVFDEEAVDPSPAVRDEVAGHLQGWLGQFFATNDEPQVEQYLLSIVRHVVQHDGERPPFDVFEARHDHDLDLLAHHVIDEDLGPRAERAFVQGEYERTDRLWSYFYLNSDRMVMAVQWRINRLLNPPPPPPKKITAHPEPRELSEELKAQVKARDGGRCLCCGSTSRLVVDHVIPYSMRGPTSVDNSQTLCSDCNGLKADGELDFRTSKPGENCLPVYDDNYEMWLIDPPDSKDVKKWERCLRRTINFMYGCAAVKSLDVGGKKLNTKSWYVELHDAVDPNEVSYDLLHAIQRESLDEYPAELIVDHVKKAKIVD